MRGSRGHTVLSLLSLAWCAGVVAPVLLRMLGVFPAGEVAIRALYAPVCHQDPSRVFSIAGVPLTVCIRCTAVYASFTAIVLFAPLLQRVRPFRMSITALCLGLAPLAVDASLALTTAWHPTTFSRMLTGTLAGITLAMFLVPVWREWWEQIAPHHPYILPSIEEQHT